MSVEHFNRLIKKIKTSAKAFTELYNFYFPKIVIFISRKYRSKDLGEVVAQDFFVKLLKNGVGTHILNPTAWVFTSCDNIAKNYFKSESKYQEAFMDVDSKDNNNLIDEMIFGEYLDKLEKLELDTREIIIMHVFEGYSLKEIAEETNTNYNTVRQKYSRGMKRLRKM